MGAQNDPHCLSASHAAKATPRRHRRWLHFWCESPGIGRECSQWLGVLMLIFEITVPGFRVSVDDRGRGRAITDGIERLRTNFFEANLALNLFADARRLRPDGLERRAE